MLIFIFTYILFVPLLLPFMIFAAVDWDFFHCETKKNILIFSYIYMHQSRTMFRCVLCTWVTLNKCISKYKYIKSLPLSDVSIFTPFTFGIWPLIWIDNCCFQSLTLAQLQTLVTSFSSFDASATHSQDMKPKGYQSEAWKDLIRECANFLPLPFTQQIEVRKLMMCSTQQMQLSGG